MVAAVIPEIRLDQQIDMMTEDPYILRLGGTHVNFLQKFPTMIFFFILYSLFVYGNVLAGPLQPLHPTLDNSFYPRDIGNHSHFIHRSIWNMIWSCFTTLFACSWVAVHPNIPAPSGSIFNKRLEIMGCMLIVPELVIVWAARQWYAAHDITKRHKDRGWTITHGFFASMGGFMLYDNDVPIKVLEIEELEQLVSAEKIDWPTISEKDIQDKSKGDFVSKGVAVLQTTWFIVQCIPRGLAGLDFTELELATLAFAVLNIILYVLWWKKPLGVACPVPIYLRHPTTSSDKISFSDPSASARFGTYLRQGFKDMGLFALIIDILITKPFNFIKDSVVSMFRCDTIPDRQLSVPTFYAPCVSGDNRNTAWIGLGIAILFGGIQCIAWSFTRFPSVPEKYLWTSSAVFITAVPFILFLLVIQPVNSSFHNFNKFLEYFKTFLILLYWASRIMLLVLAVIALRSLPPDLLLQVNWSSYMPHT